MEVSLFSIARRKRREQKRKDREEKILDGDQKEKLVKRLKNRQGK